LKETPPRTKINSRECEIPEHVRRNHIGTRTQKAVCATLAYWEVGRPKQVLNDLHRHADSINDRAAGAEVTNDHDLGTGAGRSCTSRRVRSPFALVESTESAGGFAIPITIDPSIILSGSGALNPVRDVARVITVATRDWRGASSDSVTAAYVPEATEASPVLGQPTIVAQQARAFVPFSIELAKTGTACKMSLST
jgi:HK97 family phage major capsid protein